MSDEKIRPINPARHHLFEMQAQKHKESLNRVFSNEKATVGEAIADALQIALTPHIDHSSENDPEFYAGFLSYVLDSLQEPTPTNVMIASALSYRDAITFAGYSPDSLFNPMGLVLQCAEMVPCFDFHVQDDDLCPDRTFAFRVMTPRDSAPRFILMDMDFLNPEMVGGEPAEAEPESTPKKKRTHKQKVQ